MDGQLIGAFLQTLRKEHQLTQKDIAKLCHVSNQAVSKWEKGDSIPDIEILETLSILYKVSINEILDGEKHEVYMDVNKRKSILSLSLAVFAFLAFFFGYATVEIEIEEFFNGTPIISLDDIVVSGYSLIFSGASGIKVFLAWTQFMFYLLNAAFLVFTLSHVLKRTVWLNRIVVFMHILLIGISLSSLMMEMYTPVSQVILLFVSVLSLVLLPETFDEKGAASELVKAHDMMKTYQKNKDSLILESSVNQNLHYRLYRVFSFIVLIMVTAFNFSSIAVITGGDQAATAFIFFLVFFASFLTLVLTFKYLKTKIGPSLRLIYFATTMFAVISFTIPTVYEYYTADFYEPMLNISIIVTFIIGIATLYTGHKVNESLNYQKTS